MNPQFKIGQRVAHRSFTDCFGKFHDAESGLIVSRIKLIEPFSMKPYFRVTAERENGLIEAAERFFEDAEPCK
jgi:hypothetical protein